MFFKVSWVRTILKILKWAFLILLALFIVLVIIRAFYFYNQDKIDAQVAKIHATKLTLDDVMGKNLPPDPGSLADATVQGLMLTITAFGMMWNLLCLKNIQIPLKPAQCFYSMR